ncbi:MAG: hypothetical protein CL504_06600 [Actinobacteria bacterium]|nr:hypothetical protein [Actinomycetota bacterium]
MNGTELTSHLQAVFLEIHGDRAGTFKVPAVDESISKARQKARGFITPEQRVELAGGLEAFRNWLIERDPEAAERVSAGRPAPQDIGTVMHAAEDYAVAETWEDINFDDASLLKSRFEKTVIETLEERNPGLKRAPLRLRDRNVRTMLSGFFVIFLSSGFTAVTGIGAMLGTVVGVSIFVFGFRSWCVGATRSNINEVSVFKGGRIQRDERGSL